jgi:hypothetical protein
MYTLVGKLVDNNNAPVEFGAVYTSDANGKPLPTTKNTQTDDQGRWKLNGINDTDFITARMVGFKQKTVPAKSAIILPSMISGILPSHNLVIKMTQDEAATLSEVPVEASSITTNSKNVGKYIAIGAASILAITIIAATVSALIKTPIPTMK